MPKGWGICEGVLSLMSRSLVQTANESEIALARPRVTRLMLCAQTPHGVAMAQAH